MKKKLSNTTAVYQMANNITSLVTSENNIYIEERKGHIFVQLNGYDHVHMYFDKMKQSWIMYPDKGDALIDQSLEQVILYLKKKLNYKYGGLQ